MAGKKYLITGITGFVGAHLANNLVSRGDSVWGLSRGVNTSGAFYEVVPEATRQTIPMVIGDLCNRERVLEIFRKERFDGVFHFSAQSHAPTSSREKRQTFDANTTSTVYLSDAIRRLQPECALVYASSAEVYGKVPEERQPLTEETPLSPGTYYGVSKVASEISLVERAKSAGLIVIIGRGFASIGPGRPRKFSISSDAAEIAEIARGVKPPVMRVGSLESRRGLMDVRDCAEAYALLMEKVLDDESVRGEAYNIGGVGSKRIGDYVEKMIRLTGLEGTVTFSVDNSKVRGKPSVQECDSSKIRHLTGWVPRVSEDQALKDLLDYWDRKITP